jgi:hypothetical protein
MDRLHSAVGQHRGQAGQPGISPAGNPARMRCSTCPPPGLRVRTARWPRAVNHGLRTDQRTGRSRPRRRTPAPNSRQLGARRTAPDPSGHLSRNWFRRHTRPAHQPNQRRGRCYPAGAATRAVRRRWSSTNRSSPPSRSSFCQPGQIAQQPIQGDVGSGDQRAAAHPRQIPLLPIGGRPHRVVVDLGQLLVLVDLVRCQEQRRVRSRDSPVLAAIRAVGRCPR